MAKFSVPPPDPDFIIRPLREMKAGTDRLFPKGKPNSVKAVLSRVRKEYKGARKYVSAKETGGVRVWRLA